MEKYTENKTNVESNNFGFFLMIQSFLYSIPLLILTKTNQIMKNTSPKVYNLLVSTTDCIIRHYEFIFSNSGNVICVKFS
jgi:hypothetical protein